MDWVIYVLLEHVKGSDVQTQSYLISMTQGSDRTSEMSPGEDPVVILLSEARGLKPGQ